MGSRPPPDPRPPGTDEHLIFVSDASAEAEQVTTRLRAHGYGVVDVPLALLVGRVAVQPPALVLCDADSEGALETIGRLRDLPGGDRVRIIYLVDEGRTLDGAAQALLHEGSDFLRRPLDLEALVEEVEQAIGPPRGQGLVPSIPPSKRSAVLVSSSSQPAPESPAGTEGAGGSAPPSDDPSVAAPVSGGTARPLRPDFGADPAEEPRQPATSAGDLSTEVRRLLEHAEQRVAAQEAPLEAPSEPRPGEGGNALLPPEVLAALEEPLEGADELVEKDWNWEDEGDQDDDEGRPGRTTAAGGSRRPRGSWDEHTGGAATHGGHPSDSSPPAASTTAGPSPDRSERPTDTAELAAAQGDARRQASTPKPPRPRDPPSSAPPRQPGLAVEPLPPPDPRISEHSTNPPPSRMGTSREELAPPTLAEPHASPSVPLPSTAPPGRSSTSQPAEPVAAEGRLDLPPHLEPGDAPAALAACVRTRYSGALAFEVDEGIRRLVFRDGDFVTAASGVHGESLISFLVGRGDLPNDLLRLAPRIPPFGRHAGAALIAQGHLAQDRLWPVLRLHAEWLIGKAAAIDRGSVSMEEEVPGRLKDEPSVFGGSTGAEVLVEILRRVVPPDTALARLGGPETRLAEGAAVSLLEECALPAHEAELVARAQEQNIGAWLAEAADASSGSLLYALVLLGVLARAPERMPPGEPAATTPQHDALDDQALRARVLARRALVDEGDYFTLLGVARDATAYDIRRAYLTLRRELEPSRVLTAGTVDLRDDMKLIVEVLEEAYEILRDGVRRERYRRAIEAQPQ